MSSLVFSSLFPSSQIRCQPHKTLTFLWKEFGSRNAPNSARGAPLLAFPLGQKSKGSFEANFSGTKDDYPQCLTTSKETRSIWAEMHQLGRTEAAWLKSFQEGCQMLSRCPLTREGPTWVGFLQNLVKEDAQGHFFFI